MITKSRHLDCLFLSILLTAILSFTAHLTAQDGNPADMKRGAIIITAVQGKAKIIKPGATEGKNATKGTALQQGEKIITEKDSYVSLAFENGSVIQVEAESNFIVEEFLQAPWDVSEQALSEMKTEPSNSKLATYLEYGEVTSGVKKLNPGSSLIVGTPLGTARILGTDFQVGVQRDSKGGSKDLSVSAASGEVAVETQGGAASVKGGFSTSVTVPPGENGAPAQVSKPVNSNLPPEATLAILQSVKTQQTSAAQILSTTLLQSAATRMFDLNSRQQNAIEDAAEIGVDDLVDVVEQLSKEKPSSSPEIAAFATVLMPEAADEIARAAATGAPRLAPEIAALVASIFPSSADQIASSVATAAPESAPRVAASVVSVVPSQAPQIASTVAAALPSAAPAIARSVARAQPQQATEIALQTSIAAPEAAAEIAAEMAAEIQAQGEGGTDANPNQIGIGDLPPVNPTNQVPPPPPAPKITPTPAPTPAPPAPPAPPTPTPPSPTATPQPTRPPNPSNP